MIRDRRDADLARLHEILVELDAARPAEWLTEVNAVRSWVFDQAPVRVTPTRNVVGHLQIHRPLRQPWVDELADRTNRAPDDVLLVGRLFVKPGRHDHGIARYLLTEAVTYVESLPALPVLDPDDLAGVSSSLVSRLGFAAWSSADAATVLVRR